MTLEQYKDAIQRSGYKKSYIAKAIGISSVYMSKIMQGERRITKDIERKFNQFLKIKPTKKQTNENQKEKCQESEGSC